MNIKCPNCQTAYEVPESKIGDKPKKMRCSRCKEVFTVKRRGQQTPYGYHEYSGKRNSLPGEFAFLKYTDDQAPEGKPNSTLPPPAPVSMPPAEPPQRSNVPPPGEGAGPPPVPKSKSETVPETEPVPESPPLVSEPPPVSFGYEAFVNDSDLSAADPFAQFVGAGAEAAPQDGPPGGDEAPAAASQPSAPPPQTAAPEPGGGPAASTAPAPTPAGGPGGVAEAAPPAMAALTRPRGIEDIYGSSGWETEAPLDLGGYAVPDVQVSQSQKIGKIMGLVSAFVFLLFLFVMFRNGWTLSLSKLPDQFAFAFSGEAYEALPPEVEGIEATVDERRLVKRGSRGSLLSVIGTVYNNTPIRRKEIILRGRLIDAKGEVRQELRLPCNKVFEDTALKRIAAGKIPLLYQKGGKPYDCTISGESSTLFQLLFANIPVDYDDRYVIEVTPVFAR
jgi:predicted Zn finger-like uncharacterized protein